jgi:excisionase family DNA binding protein
MNNCQPPTSHLPDILRPSDVARLFRVDTKTITRWADTGKLTSFRTPGGERRYYRDEILSHIKNTR